MSISLLELFHFDAKVPEDITLKLRQLNYNIQVIRKIVVDICILLIGEAICQTDVAIITTFKWPREKTLLALLQPTVQVEQRHGDGAEDVAGPLRIATLSQRKGEGRLRNHNDLQAETRITR